MKRRRVSMIVTLFVLVVGVPRGAIKAADAPRPIALDDILAWKSIGSAAISNDGRWLAYRLSPIEGDGEIVIRSTQTDKELRFPAGEIPLPPDPAPAAGPPPAPPLAVVFSDDSRSAAYTIYPTAKEAKQLRRQNRPLQNKAGLVNLETFDKIEIERVKRFAFAGERARWIAFHRYGAADAPVPGVPPTASAPRTAERPKGSDLILRDLKSGAEQNIGNVADFAFDKPGRFLAWTIDAQDKIGNCLVVRNLTSGVVTTIDSDKASFERPTWTEKGDGLAAVKGIDDKRYGDKLYSLVGATDIDAASPRTVTFKLSSKDADGFTISPNRSPLWTEDLSGILFGIHEPRVKDAADREGPAPEAATAERPALEPNADAPELPNLMLWHWRDPRLQSQQQVQEALDRNFSYLAVYRVKDQRFIRLADEAVRDVTPAPHERWGVGRDVRGYELEGSLDGRVYADLYAVNLETGERTPAAKKVRWAYGPSPDGTKVLYYSDGEYFVCDMASGKTTDITKGAPVEFWNADNDQNVIKPPVPPVGWAKDARSVLLSDGWDVWNVPVNGGAPVNLTLNGRKDAVRYRRHLVLDPDEKGIDLTGPVYFETYGEWTKKQGIARLDAGRPGPASLAWDDAMTSRVLKAKHSDVMLYSRETYKEYPNYYLAERDLKNGRRVTDANPQQNNFAWSAGSMLVNYISAKGDKLQGALYLPANYEKGKTYPTIVHIYERLSQQLNQYAAPSANGFNKSVYTSRGYAVLEPDIKYRVNDPGMSAVWCVVPAVKAAIATGVVDPVKVGIQGHSWGGYQTAFLVTQTDVFAAAVAGAPLTDMISMYSLIYKNSGGTNQAIFESSQGRFYGGYWDNLEAYMRNSPIFHAKNVKTPLMILHNDRDGAVDFTQGVEYYNTLRRMGKPVVLLEYLGENHGLRKPVNQQDYTVRMQEFFDHHLMGRPAPAWLTSGVPRLKMEEHLKARQKEQKAAPNVRTSTDEKDR